MSQYVINGGKRLEGEVVIGGSKNAILPIMAATLLSEGMTYLENCPRILDVEIMIEILRELGCQITWQEKTLKIDTTVLAACEINEKLVKKMRSSIILLGALMGRLREAKIGQPGGCQLGARPIDLHLESLKKMGVLITEEEDIICCKASHLRGATINLRFPSVGATENIMLAATKSEGKTVIYNPAREPEIVDLQDYLVACGAKIAGAGTNKIVIEGVQKLSGIRYKVIPDRIVAGTYLAAAAITKGEIILRNICCGHMKATIEKFQEMGCKVATYEDTIRLKAQGNLKGLQIGTSPYPGFPTDMQSQMLAVLCTCQKESYIMENLFESRFKIADELRKMGAHIDVEAQKAHIYPITHLYGATVRATDLRGGAALVVAGLCAEGYTIIEETDHIKRGYEDIVGDLRSIGAQIEERE